VQQARRAAGLSVDVEWRFVWEDDVQDHAELATLLAKAFPRSQFTGSDYGFATGHTLTAGEFTTGAAAVNDTPQFIWNPTTHTLYWDSDGNGSHAAVIIASFLGSVTVGASDIHFT